MKFKAPAMKKPHVEAMPSPGKAKVHPSAARIRLPQGMINTSQSDPAPAVPGAGRI